jgi:hypothetical protein
VGCQACEAGSYSYPAVNQSTCELCAMGTYSTQRGALQCTPCPIDRNLTYQLGSSNQTACKRCSQEQYVVGSQCTQCSPNCRLGHYEAVSCTETTDRICALCDHDCGVDQEPTACPVVGPHPGIGCKMCDSSKKPPNSNYIRAVTSLFRMYCLWECQSDYFAIDNERCQACTVRNQTNCVNGYVPRGCTKTQDFTCSVPCINNTKPLMQAVWKSDCQWSCEDGNEAVQTPTGLWFCRRI